jgi:hypothetical protein
MPFFCSRDDGWPKKRCYIKYDKKNRRYTCRYWSKGLTEHGCGEGMWRIKATDGDSLHLHFYASDANKNKPDGLFEPSKVE